MRAGTSAPLLFPNTSTRQPSTPQKGVTAALQNTAKNAQTEWDGRKKNTQSIPKTDKINKDTGKDTAEFLGVDSNEILSCTIYHGESKEEIDLTEASGKYLLQMLSDFFNDSKYTYNAYDEVITLQFESLEDLAQSVKRNYYIWIQLGQRISYSLQGEMLEEFNIGNRKGILGYTDRYVYLRMDKDNVITLTVALAVDIMNKVKEVSSSIKEALA